MIYLLDFFCFCKAFISEDINLIPTFLIDFIMSGNWICDCILKSIHIVTNMDECLNTDLGLLKLKMPSPLKAEAIITYDHELVLLLCV